MALSVCALLELPGSTRLITLEALSMRPLRGFQLLSKSEGLQGFSKRKEARRAPGLHEAPLADHHHQSFALLLRMKKRAFCAILKAADL